MYTLRKIFDNVQHNQLIGDEYSLVDRESNYDEFCRAFEVTFGSKHVADDDTEATTFSKSCYAILFVNGGSATIPLYKKQSNYIMTDSGKTFANLTYR